jgi:hypothetical protein
MNDQLGPTGDFPHGKLNADDEGALNIAISRENGVVRIDFGEPTAWIGLPPELALEFASVIVKHALALKHGGGKP